MSSLAASAGLRDSQLQMELRRAQNERDVFRQAGQVSETQAANLQRALAAREGEIDRWRQEVGVREAQVGALRGMLEREQGENRALEGRLARVAERRLELRQQVQRLPLGAVVALEEVLSAVDRIVG